MESLKFADVLKFFEKQKDDRSYTRLEKSYDERKVIENDVKRTVFIDVSKVECGKHRLLRKILFLSLNAVPNKYTQGMSEIGSIFILHYFGDIVNNEVDSMDDQDQDHSDDSQGGCSYEEQYIDAPDDENFKQFISKNEDVLKKVNIVLTNVFEEKFESLVANDFQLYKENIKVFLKMMKKRNIELSDLESHKFMGSIFTFFLRNLTTVSDVHKVFELILSCPNTCPFLLLVIFYPRISKNKPIRNISNNIFQEIIELEREFLETEENMTKSMQGFPIKNAILFGGVISVAIAIFIYRTSKKE